MPLPELLVPLFFVLMGLQVDLSILIEPAALAHGTTLIVSPIIEKLVCALGVVGPGIRRLAVGIGMAPRGEVGLIFAGIGNPSNAGRRPNSEPECLFIGGADGADNHDHHTVGAPASLQRLS